MLIFAPMKEPDTVTRCKTTLAAQFDPELFRALGDETRLTLIARLAASAEPLTVTQIAGCCGVHLSGVSRHLAALRHAGVVQARKEGREVRYTLDCGAMAHALRKIAAAFEACQEQCRRKKAR